jgi:hypothetical protein
MLDVHVYAIDIAEVAKPFAQSLHFLQRPVRKNADPEHQRRLLRSSSRRPR